MDPLFDFVCVCARAHHSQKEGARDGVGHGQQRPLSAQSGRVIKESRLRHCNQDLSGRHKRVGPVLATSARSGPFSSARASGLITNMGLFSAIRRGKERKALRTPPRGTLPLPSRMWSFE